MSLLCSLLLFTGAASAEDYFPTLTVGNITFSNVTITARTPTHVSFTHAQGLTTTKVGRLDTNTLILLGYHLKTGKSSGALGADQNKDAAPSPLARLAPPLQAFNTHVATRVQTLWQNLDRHTLIGACVALAVLHLVFSYCIMLICEKAGKNAGPLGWVPLLQFIPLLRAAGLSAWLWLLYPWPCLAGPLLKYSGLEEAEQLLPWVYPVVTLSLIIHLIWCLKIAQACNKNHWLGLLLYLPAINIPAFLYLAFSSTGTYDPTPQKIQLTYSKRS